MSAGGAPAAGEAARTRAAAPPPAPPGGGGGGGAWVGRGDVEGVVGGAVAGQRAVDARAAGAGVLAPLQDEHAGPFAHDEAVAAGVERSRDPLARGSPHARERGLRGAT